MSESTLEFTKSDALTLGVELELQLLTQRDYDLTRGATDLLSRLKYDGEFGDVKLEITESMIEVSTQARATVDEGKRRELYGEAQKLMHAEVPSIIPTFFDLLAARREWVQGYELHPRGAVFRLDHVSLGANAPKRA